MSLYDHDLSLSLSSLLALVLLASVSVDSLPVIFKMAVILGYYSCHLEEIGRKHNFSDLLWAFQNG